MTLLQNLKRELHPVKLGATILIVGAGIGICCLIPGIAEATFAITTLKGAGLFFGIYLALIVATSFFKGLVEGFGEALVGKEKFAGCHSVLDFIDRAAAWPIMLGALVITHGVNPALANYKGGTALLLASIVFGLTIAVENTVSDRIKAWLSARANTKKDDSQS